MTTWARMPQITMGMTSAEDHDDGDDDGTDIDDGISHTDRINLDANFHVGRLHARACMAGWKSESLYIKLRGPALTESSALRLDAFDLKHVIHVGNRCTRSNVSHALFLTRGIGVNCH